MAMLPSPTAAATRFTGTRSHVAAGEDAGHGRLEQVRVAIEVPRSRGLDSAPVRTKPRGSSAISPGSQAVSASAPMKMNRPPDSSLVVSRVALFRTSIASSAVSPIRGRDLRLEEDVDVRPACELVDEVARHALLQAFPAVEDGHAAGMG